MRSFGTDGDGLDNATIESFWSSMQIKVLNRQKWRTQVELANAMFDYIKSSITGGAAAPSSVTAPDSGGQRRRPRPVTGRPPPR